MKPIISYVFRHKKIILIGLVPLLLGLCYYIATLSTGQEIQYRTVPAMRGSIRAVIQATGTLEPVEKVDVGTRISGTVTEVYIDYNSKVKQGQLIAEIDPAILEAEVFQAEANLLAAKADLAYAEAEEVKAEKDYNRSRELAAKGDIAQSAADADESAYLTAKAKVEAARAKVAQYEAALAKAKTNLGYTKIYSPVDGVVVAKNVERGQTVAASYSTPSIAVIAKDLRKMQIAVNVDEADIGSVKQEQKAEFTVDAFPDRMFTGEVSQIRLEPKTADNVVTYIVIVTVDNDEGILLPGMTANVSLIIDKKDDVIMVPNAAFRFKPVDLSSQQAATPFPHRRINIAQEAPSAVYTLKNNKVVKIDVQKGITDGTYTEIVSGLEEGTEVIVGIVVQKEGK